MTKGQRAMIAAKMRSLKDQSMQRTASNVWNSERLCCSICVVLEVLQIWLTMRLQTDEHRMARLCRGAPDLVFSSSADNGGRGAGGSCEAKGSFCHLHVLKAGLETVFWPTRLKNWRNDPPLLTTVE